MLPVGIAINRILSVGLWINIRYGFSHKSQMTVPEIILLSMLNLSNYFLHNMQYMHTYTCETNTYLPILSKS